MNVKWTNGNNMQSKRLLLAEDDPMHKSGARSFVLRRWMINEGSFTLSVGLSTGGCDLS